MSEHVDVAVAARGHGARRWLALALGAGLFALLAHRSQEPALLGRYSLTYACLLAACAAAALTVLTATRRAATHASHAGGAWTAAALASLVLWLPHALDDIVQPSLMAELRANPVARRLALGLLCAYALLAAANAGLAALLARRARRLDQRLGGAGGELETALAGSLAGACVGAAAGEPSVLRTVLALVLVGLSVLGVVGTSPRGLRPHLGWLLGLAGALAWTLGALVPMLLTSPGSALASALGVLGLSLLLLRAALSERRVRVTLGLLAVAAAAAPLVRLAPETRDAARSTAPGPSHAAARLNVVVVTIDTLRADHMGPWGYAPRTTPALDRLLSESRPTTLFTAAWSGAASTVPSVTALFTAAAPSRAGLARAARQGPRPGAFTLAEAFRRAGYATAGVSANHLVAGRGFEQGFETWCTLHSVDRAQRAFLFARLLSGGDELRLLRAAARLGLHEVPGQAVLHQARTWLRELADRPFFAYVHMMEPHWPYGGHGYALDAAAPVPAERLDFVDLLALTPGDARNARLRGTPELRELIGRYDQEVRRADDLVAELLRDVREAGLARRTLVVLLGDHGEEFFEHDGFGHGFDVFPEQVHVPLVVVWPDDPAFARLPRRVDAPVSLLDVFPTLADYAGVTPPPETEGRTLRPLLEGDRDAVTRPVLTEAYGRGAAVFGYREGERAVRIVCAEERSPRDSARVMVYDARTGVAAVLPYAPADASVLALVARARAAAQERWEIARAAARAAGETLVPRRDDAAERLRGLGYIK